MTTAAHPNPDVQHVREMFDAADVQSHAIIAGDLTPTFEHTGLSLIAAEQQRQRTTLGFTAQSDRVCYDDDGDGDLARAAACYALPDDDDRGLGGGETGAPFHWPWDERLWKPTPDDRVRELVKAGALIASEIDRLLAAT